MRLTDRELDACLDALNARDAGDWDESNYRTKKAATSAWKAMQSAIKKLSAEAERREAAKAARMASP